MRILVVASLVATGFISFTPNAFADVVPSPGTYVVTAANYNVPRLLRGSIIDVANGTLEFSYAGGTYDGPNPPNPVTEPFGVTEVKARQLGISLSTRD
jgi:hypothetical protein